MNLPVEIRPVDIVDGKDEDEMWKIFNALFNELRDGDELYFDLTHSFRYIPMLVLVLGNYYDVHVCISCTVTSQQHSMYIINN